MRETVEHRFRRAGVILAGLPRPKTNFESVRVLQPLALVHEKPAQESVAELHGRRDVARPFAIDGMVHTQFTELRFGLRTCVALRPKRGLYDVGWLRGRIQGQHRRKIAVEPERRVGLLLHRQAALLRANPFAQRYSASRDNEWIDRARGVRIELARQYAPKPFAQGLRLGGIEVVGVTLGAS